MTTLSSFVPVRSASTLAVGRILRSVLANTRISSPAMPASVAPRSYVVPSTGIPLVLFAVSVTGGMPVRSGVLPWLKITIPTAPAAAAFSAFSSKVQTPRWSSAMFPAGKPAKSVVSQPLSEVFPSPSLRSTAVTGAVTSPGSDWSMTPKSTSST